ncbi:hypothetical protein GLAREA_03460 [Glarea lozoyensis ATCC 20868]|uniref:JmjC domain-containing protein n=1 Tax=Glarea lozoyensis (strain ATCC 20868 / MF5171) TaxID=1116229 RepID=S3DVS5_GLAL2|nr:uncharacterized protein GLAREA_03460 [Glarea lozoyensis ATCC 20868]EPE30493.1 hypothetical protein GLAREA_03460 [Glarea lozoyensis ATCC 20868]
MAQVVNLVGEDAEQNPNIIDDLLKTLDGFDRGTINTLSQMDLSPLSAIPGETTRLWTETSTTTPCLFPSSDCWTAKPPSTTQLILSTLDFLADPNRQENPQNIEFNVFHRGEAASPDLERRLAITQLLEPDRANPVHFIGFKIRELPDEFLKCPLALSEHVEPYEKSGHQLILTPKYTLSDFHIDSTDGLSVPLGDCKKVWICFPPTANNLDLIAREEGRKAKIRRIGKKLEGGVIFETTSEHAVYLPVGCIHAVFTTTGGFLNAMDFTTPDSVGTYALLFNAKIDRKNSSFGDSCFNYFGNSVELCLDEGLDSQNAEVAVKAWVEATERVLDYAEDDRKLVTEWKENCMVFWNHFLEKYQTQKLACPCGKSKKGEFVEHFREKHLWAPSREKSPRRSKSKTPGASKRSGSGSSKASGSGSSKASKAKKPKAGKKGPPKPEAEANAPAAEAQGAEVQEEDGPVEVAAPAQVAVREGLRSERKRGREEVEEVEEEPAAPQAATRVSKRMKRPVVKS